MTLASALLVTVTAVVAYLAATEERPTGIDLHALHGVLATGCAVLALVAGFVSCLRWRMVGNASSLRTGAALLLYGALVATAALVPFVGLTSPPADALVKLDAAMLLTVVALLTVAVVAPPINTRVAAGRRVLGVTLAVACLFALTYALPVLESFGRSITPPLSGPGDTAAHAAVATLWALLGLLSILRGVGRTSWLWTWLGLMLLGLAVADGLSAMAVTRDDLWTSAGLVVRLLALLFVLNGVAQELKLAFLDQRARLFDTRLSVEASEVQRRVEQAEREERAHEARSAILGIQAATRTLAEGYGGYGSATRTELRDALEAEIQLLRLLVDGDRAEQRCEPFDVAAAVSPAVACRQAAGCDVRAELAVGLCAVGRAAVLTQIVQGLLDNARDHAPASPVTVRTRREGDRIAIRVEDRGPGVAPEQRDRIFRRGITSSRAGTGLGLYVARRLLREQDGDIRVEARPGGGASFVVTLPVASLRLREMRGAELVHHADHAGELGEGNPLDAVGGQQ